MKAMKRVALIAMMVAVALVFAACGDSDNKSDSTQSSSTQSSSTSQEPERVTVGVALPDLTAFQGVYGLIYDGMKTAAEKQNVDLQLATVAGEFSAQKYVNAIDDVVARGVKVVGFQAFDPKIFKSMIGRLDGQGVKVVNVGDVAVGGELSVINTDTKGAVYAAMEDLSKQLGGSGTIGMLGQVTTGVVRQRIQYAKEAAKKFGLTVAAVATVDCTVVSGANVTQDLMQAHSDLDAIFAGCGQPGVGAANAVKQAGKDVLVYAYDGSQDELKAIKAGTLAGTVRQRFEEIGAKSVEAMAAIARGEQVEENYPTGFDLVSKSSVDQFLK